MSAVTTIDADTPTDESETTDLPHGWAVEPLTGTLGAVIHGATLASTLSDDEVACVRSRR